jgi:hypothetical protein
MHPTVERKEVLHTRCRNLHDPSAVLRRRIRRVILLSLEEDLSIFSEDRVDDALQLGIDDAMTAFRIYFLNGGHRGPTGGKQCHAVSINTEFVFRRRV